MTRIPVTYSSRGRDYDAIVPGAHSVLHDVQTTTQQQADAAAYVSRHALESADLAELLAMLGLDSA